jgi:hypothetical protein
MARPLVHDLHMHLPRPAGELTLRLQLSKLRSVVGVCRAGFEQQQQQQQQEVGTGVFSSAN